MGASLSLEVEISGQDCEEQAQGQDGGLGLHCRLSKASHGSYKIVSRPALQGYISSIRNSGKERLLNGAACRSGRKIMDANFVNHHPSRGGLLVMGAAFESLML